MDIGEHRGHRLIERRGPNSGKAYRLPEAYRDLNISECIRRLRSEGWDRSEISRVTGIRYQHVRNVLEGETEQSGNPDDQGTPPRADLNKVDESDVGSRLAFSEIVGRAERGDTVAIEREGKVVARLVPAIDEERRVRIAEALRRMEERRRRMPKGNIDFKELIDEGRP